MFTHFYNKTIKRTVGAFGALFRDIYIVRDAGPKGSTSQVKVPIAFAPRRKYLERIRQREEVDFPDADKVAIRLPRMSFEILAITFDPERMLPKLNHCTVTNADGTRSKVYTKTPYNISFQLNIYARTHDDAVQVVEQILPYFTPAYTLRYRPLEDHPQIVDNLPLSLVAVSFSDDFENTMEARRTIIYTLDFEMKTAFYGPVTPSSKIIKQADINYYLPDSDSGWILEETYRAEVVPRSAGLDSDHTIVENLFRIGDGDSAS